LATILGAVLLIWYPLRGKYLAQSQEKALAMHAEKHARPGQAGRVNRPEGKKLGPLSRANAPMVEAAPRVAGLH